MLIYTMLFGLEYMLCGIILLIIKTTIMIAANELRIGNLVMTLAKGKSTENGLVWQTRSLNKHSCKCELPNMHNSAVFMLENIYPIPLTEEWLPKFSLIKDKDDSYAEDFDFIYSDKNKQFRITKNKDGYWNYWPEELFGFSVELGQNPYVHQLQNLHFALAGEELILDSKT